MNSREMLVHSLGTVLFISAVFHSQFEVWSSVLILPLISVSIAVHLNEDNTALLLTGLFTLLLPFFFPISHMGDLVPLSIFTITLVIPLVTYWTVVLAPSPEMIEIRKMAVAAAYYFTVVISFYLLLFLLNIEGYLLAEGNQGVQAIALSAVVIAGVIPYYLALTLRS